MFEGGHEEFMSRDKNKRLTRRELLSASLLASGAAFHRILVLFACV
jgi:hypothetical protein